LGVSYLPAVLSLEVVGEADEVVAGIAVGADDLLGSPQTVRTVRVAMEVAAKEAAFSVLEQILCYGNSSL
jgi:hypothetical protein